MKKILAMAGAMLMLAACGGNEKEYDATGTFEATEVTVAATTTTTVTIAIPTMPTNNTMSYLFSCKIVSSLKTFS